MQSWSIFAKRWPDHMLELQERCALNPDFSQILSDYEEAWTALDRWRGVDPAGSNRIADYERLVCELEAEIEQGLNT